MKSRLLSLLLFLCCVPLLCAQEARWWKGNTHAHTNRSDGDEWPRRVVRWYYDHEYHFLAITDHDEVTSVGGLGPAPGGDFLLIPGMEITDAFEKRPVHVCALGVDKTIAGGQGATLLEMLQNDVAAVRAAGGVPQINHPNWKWSFGADVLRQVRGAVLFELFNANRDCNNWGGGGKPGMEEMWDQALSAGALLYGVASDDTHDYEGEASRFRANPGLAWVMVRSARLTVADVLSAMEKGDFYASTGVELLDVQRSEKSYSLKIKAEGRMRFTTRFIGQGGRVLKEDFSLEPRYNCRGDEGYVRARVQSSGGEYAWCQPVMLPAKK